MQNWLVLQNYQPLNALNRMGHEGDVENARKIYIAKTNSNLLHLLKNRFSWMNNFIQTADSGVELGAGIGASREFIDCDSLLLTDFLDSSWLDEKNIDALNTNFNSEKFDFVIASNMIHHLAFPSQFFRECERILKPEGKLIIQEIHSSFMMRIILRIMRHEGFNESIDVFDYRYPCNDPNDPWSANCSIPKLLFKSHKNFEANFPEWEVIYDKKVEFFQFLNSGGVVAKTLYIPLNKRALQVQDLLDRFICILSSELFPLQRRVVLRKRSKTL